MTISKSRIKRIEERMNVVDAQFSIDDHILLKDENGFLHDGDSKYVDFDDYCKKKGFDEEYFNKHPKFFIMPMFHKEDVLPIE